VKGDLFVDVFFFHTMQYTQVGSLGTGSGGGKAVVLQGECVVGGSGIRTITVLISKRAAVSWDENFNVPARFGE